MSSLKNIPVVTETRAPRSGEKYVTPQGFTAIKDGQKSRATEAPATGRKPSWIRAPLADPECDDPTIPMHAYRGGDWAQNTLGVYSGVRLGSLAHLRATVTGFRCATEAK